MMIFLISFSIVCNKLPIYTYAEPDSGVSGDSSEQGQADSGSSADASGQGQADSASSTDASGQGKADSDTTLRFLPRPVS